MDKILVVDDEQSIRHLLRTILTNTGYDVIEAANGEQGFETALDEKPDLIITDIMMPIKDGYELAHDLRSNSATASGTHHHVNCAVRRTRRTQSLSGGH